MNKPASTPRTVTSVLAPLCLVLLASPHDLGAGTLKLPMLWQKDLQTLLESAATVADIRGNNRDEVVVAGREELFALDGSGKELWRWRTKARFMTYPAVLQRPGHPSLIYAADNSGLMTCLDGLGKEVWHAQLKGPSSWSASVLCELDADGKNQVIQTDETGLVWAFDALNGKVLWQTQLKGSPVSPAVGDLDGDGKPEIVIATGEGILTALKSNGQILWQRNLGGASPTWATSAPIIFAGSDGRARVVAASSGGEVFCLAANGDILWQRPVRGQVASTISVGDLDMDGRADICLITQTGVIYRFDERGRGIWEIDMQGRSLAPGAMIDLNGDGKLEYVLCTQSGLLLALNNDGEFLYRYQFEHRTINVTPTFGDISPESPGLEMFITGGESGLAACFRTPAGTNATVHWGANRHDAHNSGAWFGLQQKTSVTMAPENLAGDEFFAGEDVRFAIQNPKPGDQQLTATAVCIRPDGGRQTATTLVLGARAALLMPVEAVAPGNYQFQWTLTDHTGSKLVAGERSVFVEPCANDRALVGRAVVTLRAAAESTASKLPLSAMALRREARTLENDARELESLQQGLATSQPNAAHSILEKTGALTRSARRGLRVSELLRRAAELGPTTSLLPFEGATWESRWVDEQLPTNAVNPLQVRRMAVPGEHEPIALDVFNITDRELTIRVHIEAGTNGIEVRPHHSVAVPTSLGEVSWDPLPELDESATLTIPSLRSRELWLDLELKNATPGEHQLKVRLEAVNGAGVLDGPSGAQSVPPPTTVAQITLEVLPFTMVPAGEFRMCTWGAPEANQAGDLLAHGNNVFCVGYPEAKFDSQGHLSGCEYSRLDEVIGRCRGYDVFLLFTGMPGVHGELGSAGYRTELKKFLEEMVGHLAAAGLDTNHFALYPVDEPGGNGWNAVKQVVEFGKEVRAVSPNVMLYVDGGAELPMFQQMAPYVSVWCPPIPMLPEKSESMDLVRKAARQLWSYNCGYGYSRPVGANLKNMNLIGDYRTAALFAFRHNASGIGFWCYNSGGDPWGRVDMEYMLVYPGKTKPVTSRRWEAVREGIEDYRIVAALKKKLENKGNGGAGEAASSRIRHLLEVSLPGMLDISYKEMSLGLGRPVLDASANDQPMGAFRREMMECVQACSEGKDRRTAGTQAENF